MFVPEVEGEKAEEEEEIDSLCFGLFILRLR